MVTHQSKSVLAELWKFCVYMICKSLQILMSDFFIKSNLIIKLKVPPRSVRHISKSTSTSLILLIKKQEWECMSGGRSKRKSIATFRLYASSIYFSFTFLPIELIYKVSLTSNQVPDIVQEKVNSKQALTIPKFTT